MFPFLSLARVAERAGVSRATIYHHWRDPDPTGSGVLDRLLLEVAGELWTRSVDPVAVADTGSELRGTGAVGEVTLDDVVLFASEQEARRVAGTSLSLVRSSQALTLHGVVDHDAAAEVLDALASVYRDTAAAFGMRVAAPLTMDDVAFLLSVAFEGFVIGAGGDRPALARTYPRPDSATAGGRAR